MTFRTLTLATVLTSATALGAYAGDGDTKAEHNAFEQTAHADVILDIDSAVMTPTGIKTAGDFRGLGGVGNNQQDSAEVGTADETTAGTTTNAGSLARSDEGSVGEQGVILESAQMGTEIRTTRGEVIGKVIGTQDIGEEGYLVFVDVDSEAKLPVSQLGFTADVLKADLAGSGLTYDSTMGILRENVLDHLKS